MRRYDSRSFRVLPGGSLEVEGRWEGVRWIALALLPVLFLAMRSPLLLAVLGVAAAYLFVFPARRRVLFDAQQRCLRIEHAGLFAEKGRRTVPFGQIQGLTFRLLRHGRGQARHEVIASTADGPVYLLTYGGQRQAAELAERVNTLFS